MQSLIQQFCVRSGTLLARRRPQTDITPAYLSTSRADGSMAAAEVDDEIKMFNGLLHSVCRKLLGKIRELDCVSGDLKNLMEVCAIPAVFVDEKLMIRSFTRESRQIYNLSAQDIGRCLLDITCGLNYCDLHDDFRRVAQTGRSVKRYLERRGCEVRYLLRILPNFCRDNSFGGAALIFSQVEDRHWGRA
jgi:hypothetical protein